MNRKTKKFVNELLASRKHNTLARLCEHVVHKSAGNRRAKSDRDQSPNNATEVLVVFDSGDNLPHHHWLSQARASANQAQQHCQCECAFVLHKVRRQLVELCLRARIGAARSTGAVTATSGRALWGIFGVFGVATWHWGIGALRTHGSIQCHWQGILCLLVAKNARH